MSTPDEHLRGQLPKNPKNWLITGVAGIINGDGETSRDFCFIDNVVQANLLTVDDVVLMEL